MHRYWITKLYVEDRKTDVEIVDILHDRRFLVTWVLLLVTPHSQLTTDQTITNTSLYWGMGSGSRGCLYRPSCPPRSRFQRRLGMDPVSKLPDTFASITYTQRSRHGRPLLEESTSFNTTREVRGQRKQTGTQQRQVKGYMSPRTFKIPSPRGGNDVVACPCWTDAIADIYGR